MDVVRRRKGLRDGLGVKAARYLLVTARVSFSLSEHAHHPIRCHNTSRSTPLRLVFSDLGELLVSIVQLRALRSDAVALLSQPWHLPFWPAGGTSLSFRGIWRARHDGGKAPRGPNGTEPM